MLAINQPREVDLHAKIYFELKYCKEKANFLDEIEKYFLNPFSP